jgi:hypothetical protein
MILVPQFLVSAVQPWADLYADSSAIATSVEFLTNRGFV